MIFIIRSGVQILSRPSSPILDSAQHAGQGMVPHAEAGAGRAVCGRPSRTPSACQAVGLPGHPALHRARPLVASRRQTYLWLVNGLVFYVLLFATGEWRRAGADQLGGVPQRRCRC